MSLIVQTTTQADVCRVLGIDLNYFEAVDGLRSQFRERVVSSGAAVGSHSHSGLGLANKGRYK